MSAILVACLFPANGANDTRTATTDTIGIYQNTSPRTESILQKDTIKNSHLRDTVPLYKPNPQKAIWYSALCPGLGQLYNRRYWKLPIVAAGIAGIAYGINWNNKYYTAYTNAYRDITDDDPDTKSYLNLLADPSGKINETTLKNILKNRQQSYRRTRDLSIIGAVGIYLVCLIDAYVDAQLYDFDISPDLTFSPPITAPAFGKTKGVEIHLAFHF